MQSSSSSEHFITFQRLPVDFINLLVYSKASMKTLKKKKLGDVVEKQRTDFYHKLQSGNSI